MAGKRGFRKYGEFTHPKLRTTAILYVVSSGNDEGYYNAEYGDGNFTCPTLYELKKELAAQMELANQLEWVPVIHVETTDTPYNEQEDGNEIDLDFERFYVAKKPDGKWTQVRWDTKPESRFKQSQTVWDKHGYFDNLPSSNVENLYMGQRLNVYLPFEQKTWDSLLWLSKQIGLIRDMIRQALGSAEGRLMLVNNAQKALPLSAPAQIAKDAGDMESKREE